MPDFVLEIFFLQKSAFWRLNNDELTEKVRTKYPSASALDIEVAAVKARKLYEAASVSFYDASSPSSAAEEALPFIKQQVPDLSEAAYSAALHIVMYNWMK